MATDFENYKSWYADTLLKLYPDRNSGFVILMVVFPLLERYLRHKNGLSHRDNLTHGCMDELSKMFPALRDRKTARNFWNVYRNGILHQVTLSRQNHSGSAIPVGWLTHDIQLPVLVESGGSFWVHPVLFSKHVLQIIEKDFGIFERTSAVSTHLPKVKSHPAPTKKVGPTGQKVILGTNTDI